MAVPILRLNIDDNPRIIVKQDNIPVTVTGFTVTLTGSGATIVSGSGAFWTVYSPLPTGFTPTWGTLIGTITNQTDLWNILTGHTADIQANTACCTGNTAAIDYNSQQITGITHYILNVIEPAIIANTECCTGNTADISYISGQTDYHYQQFTGFTDYFSTLVLPAITGNTADITNLTEAFTGHTGNTAIHFTGHTFTASGGTVLGGIGNNVIIYSPTGATDTTVLVGSGGTWTGKISGDTWVVYTPDYTQEMVDLFNLGNAFTGHTGNTDIHTPYSAITFAISAATSGLTSSWSGLTGLPTDNADLMSVFSGYSLTGHVHTQYLTGFTVTCDMVTGCTDILYSKLGHTHAYSAITDTPDLSIYITGATASGSSAVSIVNGNLTIYAPSGSTGGGVSEAVFTGYTGVTAPATYAPLLASIKQVTGTSYTLLTTDLGKIIQFTATGATTITIPSGSTFLEGFQVTLVNYGNGTTSGVKTIAAQSGATVKSANSALKLSTIFGMCSAYYRGSNTWVVAGDLTA